MSFGKEFKAVHGSGEQASALFVFVEAASLRESARVILNH